MSKVVLIIIGIIVLIMGIMGLVPGLEIGSEPMWHAILKTVIGAFGLVVGLADKKK
jgi:uncharacterized membrane protein HdeD (DUF308 family)